MSFTKSNGLLTAAFLLSVGATVNAFAQEAPSSEGIVRITDGKSRSNVRQAGAYQNTAAATPGAVVAPPLNAGAGCPSGDCQNGNCPYGGYGGHCRGKGCLFNEHYCKHSPDYGYSPPAKYPLHRRGVEYNNYYPAQWYGAGADYSQSVAPMVYQPTDTTQMGFYYQHVPYWRPQPNRLPERPIPAQWNITPPPVSASGFCRGNAWQMGYTSNGYGMNGNCPTDGSQGAPQLIQNNSGPTEVIAPIRPTPNPTEVAPLPTTEQSPATLPADPGNYETGAAPNPLPPLQSTVPPSPTVVPALPLPATNSASSGHIRRSGYRYFR